MPYPDQILPHKDYKVIACDISKHFVIRHFDITTEEDELFDALGYIQDKYLFDPTANFGDLSCSLLGVFETSNTSLNLTKEGKEALAKYCEGNFKMDVEITESHFEYLEDRPLRRAWYIKIGDIDGASCSYEHATDETTYQFQCEVHHTPMLWNFWHMSIRWKFEDAEYYYQKQANKSISKGNTKRVAAAVRILLKQNIQIEEPKHQVIEKKCYIN